MLEWQADMLYSANSTVWCVQSWFHWWPSPQCIHSSHLEARVNSKVPQILLEKGFHKPTQRNDVGIPSCPIVYRIEGEHACTIHSMHIHIWQPFVFAHYINVLLSHGPTSQVYILYNPGLLDHVKCVIVSMIQCRQVVPVTDYSRVLL